MAEPLHIPASLRPWAKAGLAFLLVDSPEEARSLRRGAPATASASPPPPRPSRTSPPPLGAVSGPGEAAASPGVPKVSAARAETSAGPASGGENREIGRAEVSAFPTLPLEQWPEPWLALHKRRPLPEHPLVVWTYAGLGDDLMGRADPARQQVIVKMLKALQHPAGTHVFWPLEVPGRESAADGQASLFWSGEALLRPRVLLVFGPDAAGRLGLGNSLSMFRAETVRGRRIVLLPPPGDLTDETVFSRSFAFLSRLLNFCAGSGR